MADETAPRTPLNQRLPYAANGEFCPGDVVVHPKLGEGVVEKMADGRMEVAFPDRVRQLVCGSKRIPEWRGALRFAPEAYVRFNVPELGEVRITSVDPKTGHAKALLGEQEFILIRERPTRAKAWLPKDFAARTALTAKKLPAGWPPRPSFEPDPELQPYLEAIQRTLVPAYFFGAVAKPSKGGLGRAGGDEAHGEAWPTCAGCGGEPELLVELATARLALLLPQEGEGFFQLFFCTTCAMNDEAAQARFIAGDASGAKTACRASPSSISAALPLDLCPTWRLPRIDSFPPPDPKLAATNLDDELATAYEDLVAAATSTTPREPAMEGLGDVGGYPYWEQDPVVPSCTSCDAPMKLLVFFQNQRWLGDGNVKAFVCPDCEGVAGARVVVER